MAWTIEVASGARKQLRKLDHSVKRRIEDFLATRIAQLDDPRAVGKPLMGELSRYWAYRVGDYRLLCELVDEKLIVLVVDVGHRREVYR